MALLFSASVCSALGHSEEANSVGGMIFTDVTVAPGFVGYIYYNGGIFGGKGGYKDVLHGPGMSTWNFLNVGAIFFDVRPKTYSEEFQLQTKDALQIPFRIHTILSPDETQIKDLIEKFSVDWYAQKVQEPLRTVVRREVEKYTLSELPDKQILITHNIEDGIARILQGMPIILHSVEVGQFLNPKILADAVETKMAALQRLEQQETEKKIATEAANIALIEAQGKVNAEAKIRQSLTPQYLQYMAILAMEKLAQKPGSLRGRPPYPPICGTLASLKHLKFAIAFPKALRRALLL